MTIADSTLSTNVTANVPAIVPLAVPGVTARLDQYSFFQALRQIERQFGAHPRIGYARRPAEESVRIGQPAELTFAPSTLTNTRNNAAVDGSPGRIGADAVSEQGRVVPLPVRIDQRFLGLLGPNGPMPLHFTESVRDRSRHAGDDSHQAFLDIFHHRIATLFYRAWSDAQPIVQRDRPAEDNFARFLGSLVGTIGARRSQTTTSSTSVDRLDDIKRFHAGQFNGVHRHAEGLANVLTRSLQVPARVCSFALRTLTLANEDRSSLNSRRGVRHSHRTNCLGHTTQLGMAVPDRSSMIDIHIGPISYAKFQQFLPSGMYRRQLSSIVRHYAGPAIDARVTIQLQNQEVPDIVLGKSGQLGRTCWMGSQPTTVDRSDYSFEVSSPAEFTPRTQDEVAL